MSRTIASQCRQTSTLQIEGCGDLKVRLVLPFLLSHLVRVDGSVGLPVSF
jgi:hypothetical protein